MKFTLEQCVKIYNCIGELENQKVGFSTAHGILIVKKAMQPHAEFFSEKERELIAEYAIPDENGNTVSSNGKFDLRTEDVQSFLAKRCELESVEVELEIKKPTLKGISEISASSLELLMEVFEFEE